MTLQDFRKRGRLSQAKFAELMSAAGFPATQALISQWESGAVELSADRCVQIELVTAGQVTRMELRPDLFGPLHSDDALPAHRTSAAPDGGAAAEADAVPVQPVSRAA